MPHFWLVVAISLYGLGLLYALIVIIARREIITRLMLPAVGLGWLFHFVSLAESLKQSGSVGAGLPLESESVLAWVLMAFFFGIWLRYKTTSHGIFVFPVAFLLTLTASLAQQPPHFDSAILRNGWIYLHIVTILAGYAALFCSFAVSVLYLFQEYRLKHKELHGIGARLPSLAVMD